MWPPKLGKAWKRRVCVFETKNNSHRDKEKTGPRKAQKWGKGHSGRVAKNAVLEEKEARREHGEGNPQGNEWGGLVGGKGERYDEDVKERGPNSEKDNNTPNRNVVRETKKGGIRN